nr:LysM domain-containing protein [Moorella sulfitireducens]
MPLSPGGGPIPCPGGQIYVVQPGDTLFLIAQRHGIPLNTLIAANPHIADPDRIQVGQPVCIPG